MFDNNNCPYPGLRPFTEEESIFFKGREEHIGQIVAQLEEKKFLMLTGASGDGKSSLVYAGVIPHARAGFFKAKFNNWVIAHFRPERDPLKNLAATIDEQFKLGDRKKTQKELSYGFSALIDTYKASPYWVDQASEQYTGASAEEQKKLKRKGANLLLLVDQFEEFFTNPENYTNGKTSLDSQVVVNLLLETNRLAVEQNVPVYIICTMRSDYIGQCSSFRGLPEFIGYSHFFVPRLRRKEFYQVIEEPALLNGNKISKRLIEMLLNEMNDGIDQLPVLQHALSQIWRIANKGKDEMDLIHFAKINGIPASQLNDTDKAAFDKWFAALPDFKKQFFRNPSLASVLDAHASELYETSNKGIEDIISTGDAKLIVKTTFKCLTKIDDSRAVRNRMTLEEVTQIINRPHITTKIVSHILMPFRVQGNTFLRPFLWDSQTRKELNARDVLDITHESLIRNWDKLEFWAQQENEHLHTWLEFEKQLKRWLSNGKSSGYLLPIGPLNFFENWFHKVRINKFWLARYDSREVGRDIKINDAEQKLRDTAEFIKKSSRRLFFSRTVIRYGADKLIAAFGVLLFLFSCTYFYFDFTKKQNANVVTDLLAKGQQLLSSPYIKSDVKADFILTSERLRPGSYLELIGVIPNDSAQIDVVREMFIRCLSYQSNKKPEESDNPMLGEVFTLYLEMLQNTGRIASSTNVMGNDAFRSNSSFVKNIDNVLTAVYGKVLISQMKYNFKNTGSYISFATRSSSAIKTLLTDSHSVKRIDIRRFNALMQAVPEIVDYDTSELRRIINYITPFRDFSLPMFNAMYPRNEKLKEGYWENEVNFNGGYYQLACLYALNGNFPKLNQCLDSLFRYDAPIMKGRFWQYSPDYIILGLIINGSIYSPNGKAVMTRISEMKFAGELSFESRLIHHAVFTGKKEIRPDMLDYVGDNWVSCSRLQMQFEKVTFKQLSDFADTVISRIKPGAKVDVYELYDANGNAVIIKESDADKGNFEKALLYKCKAFLNNFSYNYRPDEIRANLMKAFSAFANVSPDYTSLKSYVSVFDQRKEIEKGSVFCYPYMIFPDGYSIYPDPSAAREKLVFLEYAMKDAASEKFLASEKGGTLEAFIENYMASGDQGSIISGNKGELAILQKLQAHPRLKSRIDNDLINSFVAYTHFKNGDVKQARVLIAQGSTANLFSKIKIKQFLERQFVYKLGTGLMFQLFKSTPRDSLNSIAYLDAFRLLRQLPDIYEQRNVLLDNIDSLQLQKKELMATTLMDTLLNAYVSKSLKYGNKLFQILGRSCTDAANAIAINLLKDRPDDIKPGCFELFVKGKAESGDYYNALSQIPDYFSSSSHLRLYSIILNRELSLDRKVDAAWTKSQHKYRRDEYEEQ
jgi:hypothetical protein